ncbi:hypothetical protein HanPSC8_Chr07g0284501 [Helianthus annuus]|nr:hypothetical protein HanPSC8_Chr07g0284501 [Helianthus annuus]
MDAVYCLQLDPSAAIEPSFFKITGRNGCRRNISSNWSGYNLVKKQGSKAVYLP